jgi:hypothetical protein
MAPKAEKKPAKKVAKTAKTGGKKKSKAKVESFKIYIYKVLKQVRQHPRLFVFAGVWYDCLEPSCRCGACHYCKEAWKFCVDKLA